MEMGKRQLKDLWEENCEPLITTAKAAALVVLKTEDCDMYRYKHYIGHFLKPFVGHNNLPFSALSYNIADVIF